MNFPETSSSRFESPTSRFGILRERKKMGMHEESKQMTKITTVHTNK